MSPADYENLMRIFVTKMISNGISDVRYEAQLSGFKVTAVLTSIPGRQAAHGAG